MVQITEFFLSGSFPIVEIEHIPKAFVT